MIVIRPMEARDTHKAAMIHIEGQPHTFLSSLGPEFVSILFTNLVRSPHGFGFVAVDEDDVIGFAVGATSTKAMFRDVLRRAWFPLAWASLRYALVHPSAFRLLFETLRYPSAMDEAPGEAESLSRGVRADRQGEGAGSLLWKAITNEARQRGAHSLVMIVDEVHAVNNWHRARNHELVRTFRMYGRTMNVYRVPLQDRLSEARMQGEIA